jgi:hypothetical protein
VKRKKAGKVSKFSKNWKILVIIQVNHNCFTRLCSWWRPRRRGRRLEQEVSGIAFDENDMGWGGSLSVLQDL